MKKTRLLSILSLFLILSSCIKSGCTDPEALNFDPDANDEDKSCNYQGSVAFWFDEETSNYLVDHDVVNLQYFFNSDHFSVGSATDFSADGEPVCGAEGVVSKEISLLFATQNFTYKVMDMNDFVWWSGSVELKANDCKRFQLKF